MSEGRIILLPVALAGLAVSAIAVVAILSNGVPAGQQGPSLTDESVQESGLGVAALPDRVDAFGPAEMAPAASSILHVLINDQLYSVAVDHWDIGIMWEPGEAICIIGSTPECLMPAGSARDAHVETPFGTFDVALA